MAKEYLDKNGLSYFWQRIKGEMRINEKSVSGSPATFSDASTLPVKSLSVSIDAVQSGSGDPSPDNIRPISGWDGVNVYVTGKNLLNRVISGAISTETGEVISGGNGITDAIVVDGGSAYTISPIGASSNVRAFFYKANDEYIGTSVFSSADGKVTITADANARKMRLQASSSVLSPSGTYQLELGSTATSYEPYTGTVYPISLPQTVYGGTLDVETGTLTVTKKKVDLSTLSWSPFSLANNNYRYKTDSLSDRLWGNGVNGTQISDKLATTIGDFANGLSEIITSKNESVSFSATSERTWIYMPSLEEDSVTALMSWFTANPTYLVYDLATPLTLSLTPTEVRTILGYNNVYADSGDVDLVYYRDTIAASNDGFMSSADKEKLDRLNLPVLQTKEYTGIIGSANDAANATFYFANIVPSDYYKQWKVHYRVTASVPGQNDYNQVSEVTLIGDHNAQRSYRGENSNTGTRSYMYNALYRATLAGCNNGYGHVLGVGLRSSNNPINTSYPRTFVIELLDYEGCTVTLWDEMKKYASIPGTGSTNYYGLTDNDGYTNGYKQTGDNNTYDRTYVASFNPKAGAGGLKQYGLFMEDGDGTYQSLTTTNGTGTSKTKNTTGFKPGRIWYLNSGSNFGSGASAGASTAYLIMPFDGRYSFNLATTLTAHEPVYLVGTIGTDGLFYLDDTWWTQSLPTTNDGKLYMYVGLAYSTTNVHLAPDHPMYWYKNGAVRLWPDGMEAASSAVSGVKGDAESTYRTGDVNITPANIGAAPSSHTHGAGDITSGTLPIARGGTGATSASAALTALGGVDKTGDTMTGNLAVTNDSGISTVVNVSHGEHHVSLYANDDYVGLYSSDKPGMVIYEDTTGDKQLQPVATTSNNGFMSAADKTKLNGIGANAQPVTGMAADGSAPSIASGTSFVDLETDIALAANHRYLCTYTVQWSSNATGRRAAKAMIGTSEVGVISQSIIAPANGAVTIHGATFWIQSSTSARTMKIQGYQNSGSALTATVRYQLIDFGTA